MWIQAIGQLVTGLLPTLCISVSCDSVMIIFSKKEIRVPNLVPPTPLPSATAFTSRAQLLNQDLGQRVRTQ